MARLHRCYQGNETKLTLLIPTFLSLCLFKRNFVAPTCSHFGKKALSRMVTMGARGMMSFHAITHRQGSETRHTHIKKGHQHHRSEFNNTHTHQYGHPLPWIWNRHTSATTAMGLKQDTNTRITYHHRSGNETQGLRKSGLKRGMVSHQGGLLSEVWVYCD